MNHEESKLQQACVAWFRAQYPQYAMLLTHPINEGSGHTQTDRRRQGIHKADGAVAGVPDLLLFMPCIEIGNPLIVHGLGIEFKTKDGRQSQEQKDFQKMFEAAGYDYHIIRDFEAFCQLMNKYIARTDVQMKKKVCDNHLNIIKEREAKEREKFYKFVNKK